MAARPASVQTVKRHAPPVSVAAVCSSDDILWSLGNNLAASHRDQALVSGNNCTQPKCGSSARLYKWTTLSQSECEYTSMGGI